MDRNTVTAVLAVCLAGTLSLVFGCGGYAKSEERLGVLGSIWRDDSAASYLVQSYTLKSDFVGLSPHAPERRTILGKIELRDQGGTRKRNIADLGSGWSVDFAMARPRGRGFVVGLSRVGQAGPEEICVLISLEGESSRCAAGDLISVERHLDGSADLITFRAPRSDRVSIYDVQAASVSEVADDFVGLPWSEKRPCDMESSSLSPDRQSWVVVCNRGGDLGLWIVTKKDGAELLAALATHNLRLPRAVELNTMVPSYATYTLTWSPDARHVYYCDGTSDRALVVDVVTRTSRLSTPCLRLGVLTNAPLYIAGADKSGQMAAELLKIE